MTQIEHDPIPADSDGAATPPPSPERRHRAPALGLAGRVAIVALMVVALVATAPYWEPLLPWHEGAPDEARIAQLAATLQQAQADSAAIGAALLRLERRVAALETRPAPASGDIGELRQQVAGLAGNTAELAAHVAAIDKAQQARTAHGTGDTALALTLLQIQGAVAVGRPFAHEYEALAALAQGRPDLASAALPLAAPAKTGVASPAVLATGLRALSRTIASAKPPPKASPGWTDAALARLRGLVTIRRIDGGAPSGPAGAVGAAELALAGGDLTGAIAALDPLTGAAAEAAGPWLRLARERLAVDTALQRLEALLTAALGDAGGVSPPGTGH